MKTCFKCKKLFDTSSTYCPSCSNQYQKDGGYNKANYKKNKAAIDKRLKENTKRRRDEVREAKSKSCADCGIKYPYWVMQFDHVRGIKKFNIGVMLWRKGISKIREEIEKCDVVCANCHANRTYLRLTKGPYSLWVERLVLN